MWIGGNFSLSTNKLCDRENDISGYFAIYFFDATQRNFFLDDYRSVVF